MKEKTKKDLGYIILLVLILGIIPNRVHANSNVINFSQNEIITYAEQVGWFSRYINGKEQIRLWSYTYGYWITDWIWV